jgi:DNA-binding CsgD family transcriptional regulator
VSRAYRRVVTGEDDQGRSFILRDSNVPFTDVRAVHWFTERTAEALRDPPELALGRVALKPPAGATTFQIIAVPPEDASYDRERLDAFYARAFEGSAATRGDTRRHPGMHRTNTIDYVVVLEGELTMILGLDEVVLRPFDTIVQRATEHAWSNRGNVPAVFVVMTVDLAVAGLPPPGRQRPLDFAALFGLTPAETELALALAGGQSLTEFATARGVSINTVRTHAARLRSKLNVHSIAEIVRVTLNLATSAEVQPVK